MKESDFDVLWKRVLHGLKQFALDVLWVAFWVAVLIAEVCALSLLEESLRGYPFSKAVWFVSIIVVGALMVAIPVMTIVGCCLKRMYGFGTRRFKRAFMRWSLIYAVVVVVGMARYACWMEWWFYVFMIILLALPALWYGQLCLLYGLWRRCCCHCIKRIG